MNSKRFSVLDPIKYACTMFYERFWEIVQALMPFIAPWLLFGLVGLFNGYQQFLVHTTASVPLLGFGTLVGFFSIIMIVVWPPWFAAAGTQVALDIYDGNSASRQKAVSAVSYAPSVLGAFFIMGFAYLILAMGVALAMSIKFNAVLSVCLSIVACLLIMWLHIRVSFSTFCIVDKGLAAMESLRCSYQLTRDTLWKLLMVDVLIFLLCIFCFGVLSACGAIVHVILSYVLAALFGAAGVSIALFILSVYSFLIGAAYYCALYIMLWLAYAYMYRLWDAPQERSISE